MFTDTGLKFRSMNIECQVKIFLVPQSVNGCMPRTASERFPFKPHLTVLAPRHFVRSPSSAMGILVLNARIRCWRSDDPAPSATQIQIQVASNGMRRERNQCQITGILLSSAPPWRQLPPSFTSVVHSLKRAGNGTPILLKIFPRQCPDVITEFQEAPFPSFRLGRRVMVEASGVRSTLCPGLDQPRHQ